MLGLNLGIPFCSGVVSSPLDDLIDLHPTGYLWTDDKAGSMSPGALATWTDLIQSETIDQATGANQPNVSLDATSGLHIVTFDGSDDYMQTGTFSPTISQAGIVYVLGKMTLNSMFVFDGVAGSNRWAFYRSTDEYQVYAGTNWDTNVTFSDAIKIWSVLYNGASSQLWEDGVSQGTGDAGAQTLTRFTLGASNSGGSNGDLVAYVVLIDPSGDTSKRAETEDLINKHAGSMITLP